jgi:hypothetical protein
VSPKKASAAANKGGISTLDFNSAKFLFQSAGQFTTEKDSPQVAHKKPSVLTRIRKINKIVRCVDKVRAKIRQAINANAGGNKQYPRIHTLWKNDLQIHIAYL